MNKAFIIFLVISVSSSLFAKGCNDLFQVKLEEKVNSVIHSEKLIAKAKISTTNKNVTTLLRKRKIKFQTLSLEGVQAVFIKPDSSTKLGRFSQYLHREFNYKFAISLGHTRNIDGGLALTDKSILLTSIQDIIRNEVGATTRHELAHVWGAVAEGLDRIHPMLGASLKSNTNIFNSQLMDGYEKYLSFEEIQAYSLELHYSLWRYKRSKTHVQKQVIMLDIAEAHSRLKEITSQIQKKIKLILEKKLIPKVESDDYYRTLITEEFTLRLPNHLSSFTKHLQYLDSELSYLLKNISNLSDSKLEAFLKNYSRDLRESL